MRINRILLKAYQILLLASAISILMITGCANTTPDFEAYLIVENECGATVDVFVDGTYRFVLEHGGADEVRDIAQGTHLLEAKKNGTEIMVFSDTLDVQSRGNYFWTITGQATITINNQVGETVKVYINDTYVGDIEDQGSETIENVPFGSQLFKALDVDLTKILGETTIDVAEVKEYVWTITP
jgi:hypothetical protein